MNKHGGVAGLVLTSIDHCTPWDKQRQQNIQHISRKLCHTFRYFYDPFDTCRYNHMGLLPACLNNNKVKCQPQYSKSNTTDLARPLLLPTKLDTQTHTHTRDTNSP